MTDHHRAKGEIKWTDKIQAICSLLTFIVTVSGFIFVYIQINQAKHALRGSTHAAIYAQVQTIDQLFVEKPHLRKFFYGDYDFPKDATEKDKEAVLSVADMMEDFFEHVTQQKENLPANKWPAWVKYMRSVYSTSPVMRRHLKENADWYDPDYVGLITGKEKEP
jgi:hypothetical protein